MNCSHHAKAGYVPASILAGGDFASQLIEEIEDEADLVHFGGFSGAGGLQHGKARAIRVQVEVVVED